MNILVEHAKREMELIGLFDKDADYDGAVAQNIVELVTVFAGQGHSGGSAQIVRDLLPKLLALKPLSPLTSNPDEWFDVSEASGGNPMWQSKRQSDAFSTDGGQTWYELDKLESGE